MGSEQTRGVLEIAGICQLVGGSKSGRKERDRRFPTLYDNSRHSATFYDIV